MIAKIKKLFLWLTADHVWNEDDLREAIRGGSRVVIIRGNISITKQLTIPKNLKIIAPVGCCLEVYDPSTLWIQTTEEARW